MDPVSPGVASNAIWAAITAAGRAAIGRKIKITYPGHQETLAGGEPFGASGYAFPVRGILKHIPKDHKIWLLTQDDLTGLVWPQGFFAVQHDPISGTWMGKIFGGAKKQIRIVAVVAPPTSQDFFRYYQELGSKHEFHFEPLKRVPLECRNIASVQVFIP